MLLLTDEKITKLVAEIGHAVHRETLPIPHFKFREADVPGGHNPELDDSDWQDFCVGDTWGGYDKIAWFRTTVPIPPHLQGRKLALRFLVGPRDGGESTAESLLYVNGQALQGIDIWHPEACLHPEHTTLDRLSVALRAWSGVLGVPDRRRFKVAELVCIDERAERYYHLADTLRKALAELNENDWRRVRLQDAVNRSLSFVDFSRPRSESYYCSMDQALHYLQTEVEDMRTHEPNKPTVVGVGHSHIDMAWLWRLQHTRDKAARTFSTVLNLMRQYPEYRFLHTSPQLFKYLSNDHPELFARVRDKVASGEFEITGGMWIEADTNLPSGESLIRQLLYGKRYLRDVFGVDSKVVWLPDVFGYSWALPQILRGCGMETFMTTKISWSQFNRFPHDTFRWRGLDGSEILTHFMTTPESGSNAYTYNGEFQPKDILGSWTNYQDKTINDELLLAFGWGDGGGGPTREMLETGRVLQNLPGFPKVEFGKAEPYFARLQERLADRDVPVWDGELYLEYHRGTYTSQAQVKRDNRKAEQLLHELEWLASLADVLTGESAYPKLQDTWELLLLNQFHDILPGSSIREVYEDSARDFECIRDHGYDALDAARQRILERLPLTTDSLVVFNSLSWARDELASVPWPAELREFVPGDTSGQPLPSQIVEEDGQQRLLVRVPNVPALGYRALPLVSAGRPHSGSLKMADNLLENDHYRIQLNERGQITSLHDKHNNRDVIPTGSRANLFQVFEDKPLKFDAWDIDFFYQEKSQEISELLEAVVEEAGPLRGVLRLRWRYRDSTLTQRLTLYASTPRIDFRTEVDWHERQV
ncbi:MAG TPA: glycoside hydrolase family 38 C-terminal domain-containing protein, partial [Trueperaceae bacterium]